MKSINLPSALLPLSELVTNLWFSWNGEATALVRQMNAEAWEASGHNPVRFLAGLSQEELESWAAKPEFVEQINSVYSNFQNYCADATWYLEHFPKQAGQPIAYFSAEFGFHESLPIYSGGLGVLAGDHCKAASDLGIPLVGVGLLYRRGYFGQKISKDGRQTAEYPEYNFEQLPIRPALKDGNEVIIQVPYPGRTVHAKVWAVDVGTITVYLMDTDIGLNSPEDRGITSGLYGGNYEHRLRQEILLGIGGIRALRAVGIKPAICHINEGHAAFLTFERIQEFMATGLSFPAAFEASRAATIFTTHTPVPAGHDAFAIGLVQHYLHPFFEESRLSPDDFIQLGWDRGRNLFNMTHLALNAAALCNGVSKLHGKVSREMFNHFYGEIETESVPIGSVTNGVHIGTWLSDDLKALFSEALGEELNAWNEADSEAWNTILEQTSDAKFVETHRDLKQRMIGEVRRRLVAQYTRNGEAPSEVAAASGFLSVDALTIGFARRFATYKRATLLFHDLKRLERIVNDPVRPVQFVFAGKAHPADEPGQAFIRQIYEVSRMKAFQGKVVIVENYDMDLARYLVQGVDVWLNNPERPMEASGTSGQKAAMNGILNFSILDGWWEEGYNGLNGWAITGDDDHSNAESLYSILENDIIPLYYEARSDWVARMKESIRTLAPMYNTSRMVQDYVRGAYLPALQRFEKLSANHYHEADQLAKYKQFIRQHWHEVALNKIEELPSGNGGLQTIRAYVSFGSVWYQDAAVEAVYYEDSGEVGWLPVVVTLTAVKTADTLYFEGEVPAGLKHGPHYTVRVRPISPNFSHSFELPFITKAN